MLLKRLMMFLGVKFGTTRMVFLLGKYAIKIPKINTWKFFIKGILANLDEKMWYSHSPENWQKKMTPSLYCLFGGLILIAYKAKEITEEQYNQIDKKYYDPLPFDNKIENFGEFENRIVLVDYADSKYFCSECEILFSKKKCK